MSTTDTTLPVTEYPTFELVYYYDDAEAPSEITVFDPEADDITTEWITAATEDAVDLDSIH